MAVSEKNLDGRCAALANYLAEQYQELEIALLGFYRSSGYFERLAAELQGELEGVASWG